MNDNDRQRVEEARRRSLAKAEEFFSSLDDEQRAALESSACEIAAEAVPPSVPEEIGARFEECGWISKRDYLEMSRVMQGFMAGEALSDPDFDAMLEMLSGAKEAFIRCRILTLLGEMVKRGVERPVCERIEAAIAPYCAGPEDLDIISWAYVRRALDGKAGESPVTEATSRS